jgi:hypothetical protein
MVTLEAQANVGHNPENNDGTIFFESLQVESAY